MGDQVIRSKKNSQTTVIGAPGQPIWNQVKCLNISMAYSYSGGHLVFIKSLKLYSIFMYHKYLSGLPIPCFKS